MNIYKISWGIRALLYKLCFRRIRFPSYLGKPLFISRCKNIEIGKRCRIYPNMRVDLIGKQSRLIISDNVSIGQNFHVVSYNKPLRINSGTVISANVFISNCEHEYRDIDKSVLEQDLIAKDIIIGEGCFIGYGAVIQAGAVLGKHCIVGSNSVVKGQFPDYCVIVGAPARIVKKYNILTRQWENING